MKKTFLLRIAIIGLFLFGLGISNYENQLHAQSGQLQPETAANTKNLYMEPQGPFVSIPEASLRIDNYVATLKNLLSGMTPGTPQYKATLDKYNYFISVQSFFLNGKTIPQAIVAGLKEVPLTSLEEYNDPNGVLPAYKQQIVNLLKV